MQVVERSRIAQRRAKLAWLLRVRGLTFKKIGQRMGGINADRARQLVWKYGRYINRRFVRRNTKWRIT